MVGYEDVMSWTTLASRGLVVLAVCRTNTFDAITSMLPMASTGPGVLLTRIALLSIGVDLVIPARLGVVLLCMQPLVPLHS